MEWPKCIHMEMEPHTLTLNHTITPNPTRKSDIRFCHIRGWPLISMRTEQVYAGADKVYADYTPV